MKKLLSLLSVLTISGSAVPTTTATSNHQKEKLNSDINYKQTNNLENLNKSKRQNNNQNIVGISEVVITSNGWINSSGTVLNNKIYFGTGNNKIYEYNPVTEQQKAVITANGSITSSGTVLNNKIYFGSNDNKVYEYNTETKEQKIVITANGWINSSGTVLNNKIYFGASDGKVYEYDPLELIESDIINIKEHLKRGLYLEYKKQNPNSEINKIYNINSQNLTVLDVIIESKQKNKVLNLENEISICPESSSIFINNSDTEQNSLTTSCSKQLTETNTIQKMNGFSKSESTANNDNWTAKWGGKFTFKASGSAGIPLVAEGKVEAGFEVSHETSWGKSRTETITDNSTSYDTEIKTTTNTMTITVPHQPVKVPPKSNISISVDTWKNNIEFILNTSQKFDGMASADFVDKNNESKTICISIKDAMLNLLKNNILPSKIKMNDDNSTTFYYDNKTKREIIILQVEIGEAIPLSLYEQNIKFKDNKTGMIVVKN